MTRFVFVPSALALALLFPVTSLAATDAELAEIRQEIRSLKSTYESRIQALEQRLKEAESRASAAPLAAPSSRSSLAAFNPAISAILQGTYANLSQDPNRFAIAGFVPGGEIGPGRRSFSLGESELVFSANADPHFSGKLILALTPENTVAVEEAYGTYVGAPFGAATRFGRFLSGLGYLNEQHPHSWDFVDAPLAYQAFLGGRYVHDGVQLKWLAPLDHFFEVGVETGNGDAFPGSPRNRNGVGSAAIFAHTGGDLGTSHSWRAGVSHLRTRTDDRPFTQDDAFGNSIDLDFSGKSRVTVADFVWKYAPDGNSTHTNLKVQGEYIHRQERGDLVYDREGLLGPATTAAHSSRQSGWYLQGVYQFMPQWRIGARYEQLDPGTVDYGANAAFLEASSFKPKRSTVMVDYNPSEFSRVRLQFARSRTLPDFTDNQWFLQYILSLGAHGAHKY